MAKLEFRHLVCKDDFATINNQSITEGGNITVTAEVAIDDTTIKQEAVTNKIYVNTDEIASVDYVDQSVTGLITESEAQDLIDERTPEPEGSDLGKFLKVGSTGTMWSVLPNSFPVTFTNVEPTSDNNQGLIVVVLEDEPTQKYNGYIYMIEEGE